jgi:hypothetical protein
MTGGSPMAAAEGFIDCVNRRDLDGLAVLMGQDHELAVFDEEPLVGRAVPDTGERRAEFGLHGGA